MKAIKQCTIKCNQAKNKKQAKKFHKNIQKITKKLTYTQKSHIRYENIQLKKKLGKIYCLFLGASSQVPLYVAIVSEILFFFSWHLHFSHKPSSASSRTCCLHIYLFIHSLTFDNSFFSLTDFVFFWWNKSFCLSIPFYCLLIFKPKRILVVFLLHAFFHIFFW